MKKIATPVFLFLLLFGFGAKQTKAQTTHLVISQVYGGGGNPGAQYTNDFIEIFNPTSDPVSVTGWSVQYASSAGTSWSNKIDLSGTIPAGGYYLVQGAAGSTVTNSPLPTPDASGNVNLSGSAGKVALVNSTTVLAVTSPATCPPAATIVDLVAFGTSATCAEGAGPTANLSNSTAAIRKGAGCTDTDNNNSDFTVAAPNPRNSASPLNPCGGVAAKTISVAAGSDVAEPATNGSFTINFSAATIASTNINFGFTGTAGFGTDYTVSYSAGSTTSTTANGILTVPTGTTQVTVNITPINDAIKEVDETILLDLSSPGSGYVLGTASAFITLVDDDIATVDVSAGVNGAEPSTNGTFLITMSDPAPAAGTKVTYTLTGSATPGADYANTATGSITIAAGSTTGTITLTTIDDAIYEGTETITITLNTVPAGFLIDTASASISLLDNEAIPAIVINEVYGGGGNTDADYKNDFIELYNPGSVAVNLNGWSVQYGSSGGSTWSGKTVLTGTIQANGYYLIQEKAGSGGTVDLPTPDDIGTIAMSGTNGKVALVSNSITLTGACPVGYVDLVGYGSANCFEGAGPIAGLTSTTSAERTPKGFDTNNNNTDFTVGAPTPKNSVIDITAPTIVSTTPADNAMNVSTSFIASVTFSENVQKGSGSIVLKKADGTLVKTLDVTSDLVTLSGKLASFEINSLLFNTGYYFEISAGAFADLDDNLFAGVSGTTAWNFTTSATPPMGMLDVTYNLNNCTGNLTDGFTQFNVTGPQTWSCTAFGRDPLSATASAPSAFQMNGYGGGKDNTNVDWLISPSFNLNSTSFPLLSFWSRTAFTGDALQLKVSTDYSGTGNPKLATWTDLNGKFPSVVSDTWTLSENINLSAYKSANTYFAFVYHSSTEDGARWTLDDITVANSATPPPPSLTVSATDIQYTFVANGTTSDKTFTFTGNDLTGAVTLTSTGAFQLSKDGTVFSNALNFTVAEANNVTETVYLRFAPTAANQNFTGTISISTNGTATNTINVNGSSIDPATTLEVVNWNMEWFGSPTLGPTNDDLQQQNVTTVLSTIGADIYGLVEVVDESRLQAVVNSLNTTYGAGTYSYVIGNYGSHVNPPEPGGQPLADAQKEAFVYKTALFSNITTRPLINNLNTSSTSYNSWSGGRYPFLMTADVTLNCVTKTINFVLIHAKANTAPTNTAYARRLAAANELHDTLNTYFADANVIILGDFNDDLDQSITTGFTTTSYSAFTTDTANYFSPTLALSLAGKKSTVAYNDIIDHVIISNELVPNYLPSSATILTDVASLINKYGTTTTDHYPVFTRYRFPNTTAPVVSTCTATVSFCSTSASSYNIPAFVATDDCGDAVAYTYTITGATERSGTTNDASGTFSQGTSTIVYTATDSWGNAATCSTTVVINQAPIISIPVAYALPRGTAANTVYIGYASATTLLITANATGGSGSYTYSWSAANGLAIVAGTANQPSVKVYATGSGTYDVQLSLTVTDSKGCSTTQQVTIHVADVRGGNKNDKVNVCHGGSNMITISDNAVQAHLNHGDMLGTCNIPVSNLSGLQKAVTVADNETDDFRFSLSNYPNPARNNTTINYSLAVDSKVSIKVYDVLGRVVANLVSANKKAGTYTANFDVSKIPGGLYFCKYNATSTVRNSVQTIKIAVEK